jgi:putative nucleotidyltransferase with HDIG domain
MTVDLQSSIARRTRLLAEVPPFRPVVVRLMKLVQSSPQSLAEIVALLRADAVLTGEVLRLANSSLFATRCEIRNVMQAVAFLGLDRINAMVLTIAIRGLIDTRRGPLTHSCWRHNLATALICQRLSAAAHLPAETCYVAGLIHDIGRLALLRVFPDYERAITLAELSGDDLLAAERDLFEIDHAEAGRWLLSQWGCPIELQNVAAEHESPPKSGTCDGPLISLVHAASQLADLMKMSVFPSAARADLPEIAYGLPPLAQDMVLAGFAEIAEWVVTEANGIELSLS